MFDPGRRKRVGAGGGRRPGCAEIRVSILRKVYFFIKKIIRVRMREMGVSVIFSNSSALKV